MRSKKILSILMALVFVTAAFCGCNGGETLSEAGSANENNRQAESSEVPLESSGDESDVQIEPYHLTLSYIGSEQQTQEDVYSAINALTSTQLNITVDFIRMDWGDYGQKLQLMLAGGDELDILPVYYSSANSYVNSGYLENLTDLLESRGNGIIEALGNEIAYAGNASGITYGIPTAKECNAGGGVFMRADLVQKYHIDIDAIHSFTDLTTVYETVSAGESGMYMITGTNLNSQVRNYDSLMDDFGVLLDGGQSLEVVNLYETALFEQRVMLFHEWYEKGYYYKDAATTTETAKELMSAGNLFSYFTGIKPGILTQEQSDVGYDLVPVYITDNEGETNEYAYSHNVNFINWGIAANSENPERAMDFLNFAYTSGDFHNLFNWGIEGQDYVRIEGTENLIKFPEGVTSDTTGYRRNMGWLLFNQFIGYAWEGNDDDVWEQYEENNNRATKSKAFGFMYDSTSVVDEISALTNVTNQYLNALVTGSVDPETVLPEFNKALYDAGLQKVMETKQEQLDTWCAEKGIQ